MDRGGLVAPFKFGDNLGQVSFTKYARPFQQSTQLHNLKKIDLVKGHHQISVATEDISKTVIITPFGIFNICSPLLGCPMLHKHLKE
jgi:hypothetical protein